MTAIAVNTLRHESIRVVPDPEEQLMARKAQMFVQYAIDLWLGELARQGKAESTRRKYRQILDPFGDTVRHKTPAEVVVDDIRAYLDKWVESSPSTMALGVTVLRGFFAFLEDEGIVRRSPADRLKRPIRKRPEHLHVVTITTDDVRKMIAACEDWQERLCIMVLFYMGVRRRAAANVRRRDVDLTLGTMRFLEKGGKWITKPVPDELLAMLRHCETIGQWKSGDDWLIPNRKPWLVKTKGERGSKLIYETVVRVAGRAGVRSHVHAFRGAFAVAFDEAHPDQNRVLQDLMGHSRPETTQVYLRRRNVAKQMEVVRDLSLGLPAHTLIPPAGFEPAFPANPVGDRVAAVAGDGSVADELLAGARESAGSGKPDGRVTAEQGAE